MNKPLGYDLGYRVGWREGVADGYRSGIRARAEVVEGLKLPLQEEPITTNEQLSDYVESLLG